MTPNSFVSTLVGTFCLLDFLFFVFVVELIRRCFFLCRYE